MASAIYDYSWTSSSASNYLHGYFETCKENYNSATISSPVLDASTSSFSSRNSTPPPPPPPPPPLPPPETNSTKRQCREKSHEFCWVAKETRDVWDSLFKGGYGANVYIITQDQTYIPTHFSVLSIASPVLGKYLQDTKPKKGIRHLRIPGVPHGAVCAFIRFLYSSCYEEEDVNKFVLHLLVLSHCFVVPLLKRLCIHYLENSWLTTQNVIDVLQLSRDCDAPRLTFICIRMIVRNFKSVASSKGWKVMKRVKPELEQDLLESVVEADSRKQERLRKNEEKKVYLQLHEAMEALIHICKDGCTTIGPRDKALKPTKVACGFTACKGIERLVRHFFNCRSRVPVGCVHCKRMWQLLELHSRICCDPESCNVPLCRHFKGKMRVQSKKDEAKWNLLVRKVREAKNPQNPFAAALL